MRKSRVEQHNNQGTKKVMICLEYRVSPGWVVWLVGVVIPYTKRLQIGSPVRAHTQVAGLIPSWGACGRQMINVSLSHQCVCLSPPSSLSKINKTYSQVKIKKKKKDLEANSKRKCMFKHHAMIHFTWYILFQGHLLHLQYRSLTGKQHASTTESN